MYLLAQAEPDWLTLGSVNHLKVVVGFGAWIAIVIFTGSRFKKIGRELAFRRLLGVAGVVLAILYNAWWNMPSRFDPAETLPLQMCDIVLMFVPIALLTNMRWPWMMIYFWGVGLSTQAFFTPTEYSSPGTEQFWVFWISHTQIVGGGLYAVIVADFKPTLRDAFVTAGLGFVYMAFVMPLDIVMGWNYGYVGNTGPAPGIASLLGPWPLRAFLIMLLGSSMMFVVWLPFARSGKAKAALPQDA